MTIKRRLQLLRAAVSKAPPCKESLFGGGYFYSPIIDVDELLTREGTIWPTQPVVSGIDFNDAAHLEVLTHLFPRFIADYDYPEHGDADETVENFYTANSQFSWLDARALFVLLRQWRPRRFMEIGSGYSTLLAMDLNRRFLDGSMEITSIEPYPRAFMKRDVGGVKRLIERKVQDVPLSEFDALGPGDILFVDSSHVSKTGSDVNFIFFEILPRLRAGVRVHVHDIFLPHDYLKDWILDGRSWNEQYIVRALLMHNRFLTVEFSSAYAYFRFPEQVRSALALPDGNAYGGSSLWLTNHAGA